MPIAQSDVIELLCVLSEEEKLKVTVKESVKGGVITGMSATAGALLIGPLGLAVGGVIGGCVAAYYSKNKFQSVTEILMKLSPTQQDQIHRAITNIMSDIQITDITILAAMMAGNIEIRRRIVNCLVEFVKHEVQMEIVD